MGEKGKKWYRTIRKHPEWFKLRTKVWDRANNCCEHEGCTYSYDENNPLDVHHIKYEKGKEPWDYPLDNFELLCRKHHSARHKDENKSVDEIKQQELPRCPECNHNTSIIVVSSYGSYDFMCLNCRIYFKLLKGESGYINQCVFVSETALWKKTFCYDNDGNVVDFKFEGRDDDLVEVEIVTPNSSDKNKGNRPPSVQEKYKKENIPGVSSKHSSNKVSSGSKTKITKRKRTSSLKKSACENNTWGTRKNDEFNHPPTFRTNLNETEVKCETYGLSGKEGLAKLDAILESQEKIKKHQGARILKDNLEKTSVKIKKPPSVPKKFRKEKIVSIVKKIFLKWSKPPSVDEKFKKERI